MSFSSFLAMFSLTLFSVVHSAVHFFSRASGSAEALFSHDLVTHLVFDLLIFSSTLSVHIRLVSHLEQTCFFGILDDSRPQREVKEKPPSMF